MSLYLLCAILSPPKSAQGSKHGIHGQIDRSTTVQSVAVLFRQQVIVNICIRLTTAQATTTVKGCYLCNTWYYCCREGHNIGKFDRVVFPHLYELERVEFEGHSIGIFDRMVLPPLCELERIELVVSSKQHRLYFIIYSECSGVTIQVASATIVTSYTSL